MLLIKSVQELGIGTTLNIKAANPPKIKDVGQFAYPPKDQAVNTSVDAENVQTSHSLRYGDFKAISIRNK